MAVAIASLYNQVSTTAFHNAGRTDSSLRHYLTSIFLQDIFGDIISYKPSSGAEIDGTYPGCCIQQIEIGQGLFARFIPVRRRGAIPPADQPRLQRCAGAFSPPPLTFVKADTWLCETITFPHILNSAPQPEFWHHAPQQLVGGCNGYVRLDF